jgi:hypothetical protein
MLYAILKDYQMNPKGNYRVKVVLPFSQKTENAEALIDAKKNLYWQKTLLDKI